MNEIGGWPPKPGGWDLYSCLFSSDHRLGWTGTARNTGTPEGPLCPSPAGIASFCSLYHFPATLNDFDSLLASYLRLYLPSHSLVTTSQWSLAAISRCGLSFSGWHLQCLRAIPYLKYYYKDSRDTCKYFAHFIFGFSKHLFSGRTRGPYSRSSCGTQPPLILQMAFTLLRQEAFCP